MFKDTINVVIPCYNEEDVIQQTHESLITTCREHFSDFKLIYVDDGSSDRTWEIIKKLGQNTKAFSFSRNFGHQAALSLGLEKCEADYIFIIDADLQDPPELFPKMLEFAQKRDADIVYGQRRARTGESIFKRFTASVFYWALNKLSDTKIPENTGEFRLINRKALNAFYQLPERDRFLRGMFSWIGFKQEAFLYDRPQRAAGETKYTFNKMVRFALDGITSFSIKPLKIAMTMAFGMGIITLIGVIWTLWTWITANTVQGWTSILTAIFAVGTCQLVILGVIGEYLGRLFINQKQRPLYIVKDESPESGRRSQRTSSTDSSPIPSHIQDG